jgi:hypothetical protein
MIKLYASLWEILMHAAVLGMLALSRVGGELLKSRLRGEPTGDTSVASARYRRRQVFSTGKPVGILRTRVETF